MGPWAVALALVGCGDDGGSTDSGADDGSSSAADDATATATTTSGVGDTTTAMATTTGVADTTTGDDGATDTNPAGPPVPEPGGCGWDGAMYGCGWELQGAECDGSVAEPGATCETPGTSCCTADGTLAVCTTEQGMDPYWALSDCSQGAGAGACGFSADAAGYVCGGDGEDPGGTPSMCDPAVVAGSSCERSPVQTCCDGDGNAWRCASAGSNLYWEMTDCVFD